MKKNSKSKEKVFYSLSEIEKEFSPKSFKQSIQEEKKENPEIFGVTLAKELLKSVEKELRE